MNRIGAKRGLPGVAVLLCVLLTAGCGSLLPATVPPPRVYGLGVADSAANPMRDATSTVRADAPTLVVDEPRAGAGFDTVHMVYIRTPHRLEHFAHSEWVDTPARMLAPRIVEAISRGAAFRAVGAAASGMSGGLRLETEVLALQQEFLGAPSRVRLVLRVQLLDNASNTVLASEQFDETAPAASDDPYGGVLAADRVVQQVMGRLAAFCADAASGRRARNPQPPTIGTRR